LADALVGNRYGRRGLCRGLRQGHIGTICDAITAAGIDPAVWSAKDIQDVLETDMRRTGRSWPDQITNPGGFLASRLRRLAASFIDPPARPADSTPPLAAAPTPHIDVRGHQAHQALSDIQRILDAAAHRRTRRLA